jgi:hypothetical protein
VGIVELVILLAGGLVGWLAVSWVITIVRQQRAPPFVILPKSPQSALETAGSKSPSLAELGDTWHTLLQVRADASVEEIEAAYHERIAECDRTRFAQNVGVMDRQDAERRRSKIDEAYAFIRTVRGRQ